MLQAEIISIGTEFTSGAKLDTNSQWLSSQLVDLGISTLFHTTVADEMEANVQALKIASGRVDLVLITGGLGPTLDDLTREAMAAAFGVKLEIDESSLKTIEKFFQNRGREMPSRNRFQAMFPEGSIPLLNPIGTAPGIWMEVPREGREPCYLAAMPGVPSEMRKMYFEQVRPRLKGGEAVMRRARINCFGLGESAVEELLGDLTARGHDPDVGITAHDATITLRINASGPDEATCLQKIRQTELQIRERIGDYAYGIEDEGLEDIIVRQLNESNLTVCTVECGTSGLLAEHLSQVPGGASCYRGGMVLPSMTQVPGQIGENYRLMTGSDFVIYVGAEVIAPDADSHPVSIIPIGALGPGEVIAHQELRWSGNPAITKNRAMKTALNLLRLHLLKLR
ncbi:CinA family nicotinamide mononucleotide deamidase-related protein [Planctomicrobium sp. SH668]|uniref:CinA family nicotinamide mononucleotide deamidase-related protein n=1 Tax=Planctomicrobium sp. SH668 TaxID=3448126 RepID=UPI003F5C5AC2